MLVVKINLKRKLRENRGLHEIFLDTVSRHPDRIAFYDIENDKSYTFIEFNRLSNQFANYFAVNIISR